MEREVASAERARARPPDDDLDPGRRRPGHALSSRPPLHRPLGALGMVTVLAALTLLWVVPDDHDEGRPLATPVFPPPTPTSPSAWTSPGATASESASKIRSRPAAPAAGGPSAQAGPTPRQTSAPGRGRPVEVRLTHPRHGQRLPADRDFTVEGTVQDLGGDDLRVFIYAENLRTFYLADYRAERIGGDGRWTIRSTGIGKEWGGEGDTYLVQVVGADRSCRRSLEGLELGHDHYPAFRSLPDGCRIRTQVRVVED